MFWDRYGGVVGWLFLVGVGLGAVLMGVLFGWLIPPDRGEESVVFVMPFFGAAVGAVSATAASLGYWIGMGLLIGREGRTVASRAWGGGLASAIGAATLWIVYGFAMSGSYGLVVWVPTGLVCGAVAAAVAGPLTARAARRADRRAVESAGRSASA